jgi:type IV pilus assembly protein PilY1
MKFKRLFRTALMGSALFAPAVLAEDIDLFKGSDARQMKVNVLIVVDSSANWSSRTGWAASGGCSSNDTAFCFEKEALTATLADVDKPGLSIGLLLYTETGSGNPNPGGAYVRYAMRPMGLDEGINNRDLRRVIGSLDMGNDKGNSTQAALAMNEAYLYFKGMTAHSGIKAKTDQGIVKTPALGALPVNIDKGDDGAFVTYPDPAQYKAAMGGANQCNVKNYVIYISNGQPASGENSDAGGLLSDLGANTTKIDLPDDVDSYEANWSDEYARFMYSTAGIQTFTVDVAPSSTGGGPDNSELLKSMAKQGNGIYYKAESAKALADALKAILDQIQSVNSVYASVALPVSVNARGTYLNQVYMGMFRPDNKPRWIGNLKLYQLGFDPQDSSSVILLDSATPSKRAESAATGFIMEDAISFWTKDTLPDPGGFWNYRCTDANGVPLGSASALLCGTPPSGSDSPDGAVLEKGGAAQMLRSAFVSAGTYDNPGRKLYTCTTCVKDAPLANEEVKTSNAAITATALGVGDAERDPLINWIRGVDNLGENTNGANGARPSMVGDVLHSRPVIVNYNSSASGCTDKARLNKDVIAFYGGNDGVLRAIRGGKNDIANAGNELWGFIPSEFLGLGLSEYVGTFKRLRDNIQQIIFPAPVPADSRNKPYLIDGSLSVYIKDAGNDCKLTSGSEDKAILFMTLRRGGRFVYAFDVIDPIHPKFLWKKSYTDSGYEELGQTWSQLTPITLGDGTPAVIFGAGYDPGADDAPYIKAKPSSYYGTPPASRSMGRGVFVVNAKDGTVLKSFGVSDGMEYSIPSDIAVLKDINTGFARYAYVGDTGGNVWKIDLTDSDTGLPSGDSDKWAVTKLASLGDPSDTNRTGTNARRFLYAPDIVRLDGSEGYAVLLGSGDREKPFDKVVNNRFYMLKDNNAATIRCEGGSDCNDLDNVTDSTTVNKDKRGWYFKFANGEGEKVVGSPVTVHGTTFFPTNKPVLGDANSCKVDLGAAYMYEVSYLNGAGQLSGERAQALVGGGLPPSPIPVTVQLDPPIGSRPGTPPSLPIVVCSGARCTVAGQSELGRRSFSYWFKETLD